MTDKNNSFISRMINGVKDGSSLRPTVTADMLSSHFIEQKRRRIIDNSKNHHNLNNSYFDDFSNNNNNDHPSQEYPSNLPTQLSTDNLNVIPNVSEHTSESQSHDLNSDLQNVQKQEKDNNIAGKKSLGKKKEEINKKTNSNTNGLVIHSFPEKDKTKSHVLNSQTIRGDLFSVKEKDQSEKINTTDLLISRDRNTISLNQHQNYLSKNIEIEIESIYRNILQRLKKSKILKTQSEPSITVNVRKITVRAVNDYNNVSFSSFPSSSTVNNNNGKESAKSNKLSLNDYLRKRAEKIQ